MKVNEGDRVMLTVPLPEHGLTVGDQGLVVRGLVGLLGVKFPNGPDLPLLHTNINGRIAHILELCEKV